MASVMKKPDLQRERWALFLRQYERDFGEGWQSDLAARLRTSASTINKQSSGERGPSRKTIQLAIEALRIAPDFFSAPWLDNPDYRDFMGRGSSGGGGVKPESRPPDSPHWRRFVALGGADRFGLSDEQVEWVRNAPFRGGAQSVDDYIAAAEVVARMHMPEPPGMAEARRKTEKP